MTLEPPRRRFDWLRLLFARVFSDQERIDAGRYCAYNAFIGLILLLAALLLWVEPDRLSEVGVPLCGTAGLILVSGVVLALKRPAAMFRLLAFHGVLIVLLACVFLGDGVRLALAAKPLVNFKYFPGPFLVAVTYGMLQTAAFGPWPKQARGVRIAGFVTGVAGEIAMAASLLYRFSRR
jgi:hypothetical protein